MRKLPDGSGTLRTMDPEPAHVPASCIQGAVISCTNPECPGKECSPIERISKKAASSGRAISVKYWIVVARFFDIPFFQSFLLERNCSADSQSICDAKKAETTSKEFECVVPPPYEGGGQREVGMFDCEEQAHDLSMDELQESCGGFQLKCAHNSLLGYFRVQANRIAAIESTHGPSLVVVGSPKLH